MASGALPPGFPAVEIDGEHYWDGGIVSNTPLTYVWDERPLTTALIVTVDLFKVVKTGQSLEARNGGQRLSTSMGTSTG